MSAEIREKLDPLPPRKAAVIAWFDYGDHDYAIARLCGCVNPSGATMAAIGGFVKDDADLMDRGFQWLRDELAAEEADERAENDKNP